MGRRIEIEECEPVGGPGELPEFGEPSDELEGLVPWVVSLVEYFDEELETEEVVQTLGELRDLRPELEARTAAAEVALQRGGPEGEADPIEGVVAGLYVLKRRGFEPGRSEGGNWRVDRVLNAGSRVLDVMLEQPDLRRLAVEALFYRVLGMALPRAEVGPEGVVAEVSCAVEWDEDQQEPLRRRLPEGPDGDVVDWLLDELMTRGLSSLTLGSVIQESRQGRDWEVDDSFADWLSRLPADEARLVVGALFGPARLGGGPREDREELLDAMSVAHSIDEDFAPDEQRTDAYLKLLRQIEGLRSLPDDLSPTFEVTDGTSAWQGRWEVSVHPVRRQRQGELGFFVLEAGLVFDQPRDEIQQWSRARRRELNKQLAARAKSRDEETFQAFSTGLDAVVDQFNRRPAVLMDQHVGSSSTLARPSPLWEGLSEGIDEMIEALEAGDADRLAEVFGRWTVRCVAPE